MSALVKGVNQKKYSTRSSSMSHQALSETASSDRGRKLWKRRRRSCWAPGQEERGGVLVLGRGMAAQGAAATTVLQMQLCLWSVLVGAGVGKEEDKSNGFPSPSSKCDFNVPYLSESWVFIWRCCKNGFLN